MPLNLDQIFETKHFSVWCLQCNDCVSTTSMNSKHEATMEFYRLGWLHIMCEGWICPSCRNKRQLKKEGGK
jgi:hypothetical protein